MPGDVDDCNILSTTGVGPNIHYSTGIAAIVDHAHAQLNSVYKFVTGAYHSIFRKVESIISFEVPTGVFSFESLTNDQKSMLKSLGLIEDQSRSNVFSGSPAARDLNAIYSLGPIDSKFTPGAVSSDGYLAYVFAIKGLQIFSFLSRGFLQRRSNILLDTAAVELEDGKEYEVIREGILGETAKSKLSCGSWYALSTGEQGSLIIPVDGTKSIPPAFFRPSSIGSWDADNNYLFPYFNGLNTINRDLVGKVFGRLFIKGLSDDPITSAKLYQKLRHGFRKLASLRAGLALAHAYKGVELAIQGEFGISFLIESGVYSGFILTGPGAIIYYNQLMTKLDAAELIAEVKKMDRKDRVLGEIRGILESPMVNGKTVYTFPIESINTSRKFLTAYNSIGQEYLGTALFTESLPKLVDEMIWGDQFPMASQKMILDFLRYVHTGEEEHIASYPAYLSHGYFEKKGRVAIGLGIFGPKAPTCSYGTKKDMTFSIPNDAGTDDPNLKVVDEKRHLQYLPFTVIPIGTATVQWNSLFSSGNLYIPPGRKGKKEFTNGKNMVLSIGGNPAFATAYGLIKEHSIVVRSGIRTGKRARADDDMEAGPSAQRKRAKKDSQSIAADI